MKFARTFLPISLSPGARLLGARHRRAASDDSADLPQHEVPSLAREQCTWPYRLVNDLRRETIPASRHRTVAVPWTHVEWIDVAASHLALEAIDVRGNFRPRALVPLDAFAPQPPYSDGFRDPPLFRLAWYGHRVGSGDSNARGPENMWHSALPSHPFI